MKDLVPIIRAIYRQLYKEATPSADFDELVRTGEAKRPVFFEHYYLAQDRQDEIIREHCKRKRLSIREREIVEASVNLGCSPRGTEPPPRPQDIQNGSWRVQRMYILERRCGHHQNIPTAIELGCGCVLVRHKYLVVDVQTGGDGENHA